VYGLERPTYLCLKGDAHTDYYTAFATEELRATPPAVLCSVSLSSIVYMKTENPAAFVFIPVCAGRRAGMRIIMRIARLLEEGINLGGSRRALFDDDRVVTYPELRESAGRIAGFLREKGVHAGDAAAIVMPRSIDYVIAETACLLYGVCVVPLDSGYPKNRIDFSVRDCGAKLIIDEALFHRAISFDAVPQREPVSEQTPAMIFYTSGSTGRPKGVLHDQESIGLYIDRLLDFTRPQTTDVIGAVAPFGFAVHLMETVRALCSGASCIVVPRNIVLSPVEIADFIDSHRITQIYLPPKLAKLFRRKGDSLKQIYTSSEPVRQIAPDDGYRLFNLFGMSETNVVTGFEIDRAYDNTPLGTALKGVKTYILDEYGQPCDEGELCVAGHFFSEYIGLPEMTAQTKVRNPFFREDGHEYMIRTGDMVRRLPDGNIVYMSRKDFMLKINGWRIEPGEIESVLCEAEGVKDAVVKGLEDHGRTCLCAFYVAEDDLKEPDLLSFISDRLAPYMIPERLVRMNAFPLNANGKTDRLSLKLPAARTECIPPASKAEETALRVAREIIRDIDFGVTDDLDTLGMDSINAILFSAALKEAGLDFSASDVIKHRNIRAILSKESRMLWFVKDYDENKPVLVITSGIVILHPVLSIYQELSRSYNILLIEPVQDHFEKKLKGLKYDELIILYMDEILKTVPDAQKIIGFMGFSFGGELAASLAHRFAELYGRKTFAILGDTKVWKKSEYPDREITREDLDNNSKKLNSEEVDRFLVQLNMINGFGYGEKYACYDGPVTLLDAGRDTTEEKEMAKLQNAKERYADLSLVPMKAYSHTDLFHSMDLIPFYFRLIGDLCGTSS